jgi:hypothetical protein
MFTPLTISSTVTSPLPSQSPAHDTPPDGLGDAEAVGVEAGLVGVWVGEATSAVVAVAVAVESGVAVPKVRGGDGPVGITVDDGVVVGDAVCDGLELGVNDGVAVGVGDGVAEGDAVAVADAVELAVGVGVSVAVDVGVAVGLTEGVGVPVAVGVSLGEWVGVGV